MLRSSRIYKKQLLLSVMKQHGPVAVLADHSELTEEDHRRKPLELELLLIEIHQVPEVLFP